MVLKYHFGQTSNLEGKSDFIWMENLSEFWILTLIMAFLVATKPEH